MNEHNQERKARREQELKEREQKEQEQKKRDSLLEALQTQFKIFREEVRFFATSAAASTTLLALLLFGELTAARAKDNPDPRLYLLIPLSLIWYGAVLAVFLSHLQVAAKYSELLEVWMNSLLGDDVFQFEASYTFPRENNWNDIAWFVVLVSLVGLLPAGCALWAGCDFPKDLHEVVRDLGVPAANLGGRADDLGIRAGYFGVNASDLRICTADLCGG